MSYKDVCSTTLDPAPSNPNAPSKPRKPLGVCGMRPCKSTMTAKRLALIGLRNDGAISDELLHRLERELDVEALRLGIGERRAKT